MAIRTQCPSCERIFPVGDDLEGKPVRCPGCGQTVMATPALAETIVQRPEPPRPAPARSLPSRLRPEPPPPERRNRPSRKVDRGGSTAALVLGIIALVVGVLALAISWVPFICVLSMFAAGAGLLMAFIGIVVAVAQGRSGVGLPIAGGAVNLLALVVGVGMLLVSRSMLDSFPSPNSIGTTDGIVGTIDGWGEAVNPARDCTITRQGDALSISVPATPHDLSVDIGEESAPRVLQEVEGDFSVQVKVCGTIHPTAPATVPGHASFQSGGLLLWIDRLNFHRLERAGMNRNGVVNNSGFLEQRLNGQIVANQTVLLPEQDTYLRMERRGNQVLSFVSKNGREWNPLRSANYNLPAKVRVGVHAIDAAQQPLSVRYEEFRLEKK